ncbi:MAG: transcription elongation factor GreA [Clostridia bacterium]|nr:transcription elongation factor GreA [Clostridia bacterium]
MANIQISKDGEVKLRRELEYLQTVKKAELEEALEVSKHLSDAEQKDAREEYEKAAARIAVLEELISGNIPGKDVTSAGTGIKVTLEGLVNLMAELDYLRTSKRQEVKEAIKVAKGFGDLSENSEYDEAREEQGKVESRIVELEEMLKSAELIDESGATDRVNVGSTVRILNITRNKEIEYHIVGSTEANASLGRISDQSPIGKAIIGEKVGSEVKVETPAGVIELKILEISRT